MTTPDAIKFMTLAAETACGSWPRSIRINRNELHTANHNSLYVCYRLETELVKVPIACNAHKLAEAIRGEDVQLAVDGKRLSVTSGGMKTTLATDSAWVLPGLPTLKERIVSGRIETNRLRSVLRAYCAADTGRVERWYHYPHVLISAEDGALEVAATDSRHAAIAREPAEITKANNASVFGRRAAVMKARRMLRDLRREFPMAELTFGRSRADQPIANNKPALVIKVGPVTITLVEMVLENDDSPPLDPRRLEPVLAVRSTPFTGVRATVSTASLRSAVRRVKRKVRKSEPFVNFHFRPESLVLSGYGFSQPVKAKSNGEARVCLNVSSLTEFLTVAGERSVEVRINTANAGDFPLVTMAVPGMEYYIAAAAETTRSVRGPVSEKGGKGK